jgi:hypothetical protein
VRRPIPAELFTWYGWHNGTPQNSDPLLAILGSMTFRPLDVCIDIYQSEWAFANELVASGLFDRTEEYWAQSWFPLLIADRNILVVDTAAEASQGLPVGMRYKEGFDPPTGDLLLRDLVATWAALWEQDRYYSTTDTSGSPWTTFPQNFAASSTTSIDRARPRRRPYAHNEAAGATWRRSGAGGACNLCSVSVASGR